jgi:Protein of unknown function (DUF2891)
VIVAPVALKLHRSLLQNLVCALVATPLLCVAAEDAAHQKSQQAKSSGGAFDAHAAERFAKLALECVRKEYPNKISHVLNSDADVAPPRKLTPAFCGCYDWHSSVHGHWLLVLLKIWSVKAHRAHARNQMVWEFSGAMAGNDFGQAFRVHKTPRQIPRRALAVGKQLFDCVVIERNHVVRLINA